MKYKMTLGDFACEMLKPSEIKFWIENEIGEYDNLLCINCLRK